MNDMKHRLIAESPAAEPRDEANGPGARYA